MPAASCSCRAPWNFPYAIPANGVVSALAAGNTVLFKPAPEAITTGAELVAQLHEAGVPADVVQLVRCPDDDTGRHLVTHADVDTVVLTGAYDTAQCSLTWKPQLRLVAETSGKNALVVTGGADIDLAIRDLVRSAFGHAGPEVLGREPRDRRSVGVRRRRFLNRLADAVRSVRVGSPDDLATMMGPIVAPPSGKLERATHHARRRRKLARRAAATRPSAPPLDPRRQGRRAAGFVVPSAPNASDRCSA